MITEVLLILPLHLILFFICWRFRRLIKIMASVGDILNDDEFLVMLPILVAAHTVSNLDFGDEQGHETERYESES